MGVVDAFASYERWWNGLAPRDRDAVRSMVGRPLSDHIMNTLDDASITMIKAFVGDGPRPRAIWLMPTTLMTFVDHHAE